MIELFGVRGGESRQPRRDLRRRQRRRRKVATLRRRLADTSNPRERERLIAKTNGISPTAPIPVRQPLGSG